MSNYNRANQCVRRARVRGLLFLSVLRMSYIEMGSTHSSDEVKGVSPLGDEIWKCSASVWCGLGFVPGAFRIEIVSSSLLEMGTVSSGGFSSSRIESADKTLVELHLVLGTNRFNERSVRPHRLLVIVISPDNDSCFCFEFFFKVHQRVSFCGLAKKC